MNKKIEIKVFDNGFAFPDQLWGTAGSPAFIRFQ